MQILSNALPGFRNLRGPLVAGYLWLLFAWLVAKPDLDERPESAVAGALFDLGEHLDRLGIAVAVSVAAYFIGALSQEAVTAASAAVRSGWQRFNELIDTWSLGQFDALDDLDEFEEFDDDIDDLLDIDDLEVVDVDGPGEAEGSGEAAAVVESAPPVVTVEPPPPRKPPPRERPSLRTRIARSLRRFRRQKLPRELSTSPPTNDAIDEAARSGSTALSAFRRVVRSKDRAARAADDALKAWRRYDVELRERIAEAHDEFSRELRLPALLLVGEQPQLFAEVDRLASEAELRLAAILPIGALTLLLAIEESAVWLLGLPLIGLLYLQGRRRERQSHAVVSAAVGRGLVPSSAVRRLSEWIPGYVQRTDAERERWEAALENVPASRRRPS